jgi:hypothetical protein
MTSTYAIIALTILAGCVILGAGFGNLEANEAMWGFLGSVGGGIVGILAPTPPAP